MSIYTLFSLLGALAMFIYGMKVFSEGIQRVAGMQLRRLLGLMTRNTFIGLLTGILLTFAVQTSSATTVLVISFVNAGLLTLIESAGLILGANIGTTVTGWFIALGLNKFSLQILSLPLLAIGVFLIFRKERFRHIGECIIGFALMFIGIGFLKNYIPSLDANTEVLSFLERASQGGYWSYILFFFLGAAFTAAIQSSSATMALILVLSSESWFSFEIAAAIILGANLGTTVTAEIASWVGNTTAHKAARIHVLFNLFGVCWMLLLLPYYLPLVDRATQALFNQYSAYTDPTAQPIALALFHTTFNVLNVLLIWPFISYLVKFASQTVSIDVEEETLYRPSYLPFTFSKMSELSVYEVHQEIGKYAEMAHQMSMHVRQLLFSTDQKEKEVLIEQINEYENAIDQAEGEIVNYLTELSKENISVKTSFQIRSLVSICAEIERIGDLLHQMSETLEWKQKERIWFSQDQRDHLKEMIDLVESGFTIMKRNLTAASSDAISVEAAKAISEEMNHLRHDLRQWNQDIDAMEYSLNSALTFDALIASMNKIGDHLVQVSTAIK